MPGYYWSQLTARVCACANTFGTDIRILTPPLRVLVQVQVGASDVAGSLLISFISSSLNRFLHHLSAVGLLILQSQALSYSLILPELLLFFFAFCACLFALFDAQKLEV